MISYSLTGPVGDRADNRNADVQTVKQLLAIASIQLDQPGWAPGNLDSPYLDHQTLYSLKAFRLFFTGQPASVLTGNDRAFQRLVEIAKGAVQVLPPFQRRHIVGSKRRPGLNEDGTAAEDMKCGDYSKEDILKLRWNFRLDDALQANMDTLPAENYFEVFRSMAFELFSFGQMKQNIAQMIDKFQRSEGGTYQNRLLDLEAASHPYTKEFLRKFEEEFRKRIKEQKGNLQNILKFKFSNDGHLKYNRFFQDILGGMTIATDDIWSWDIELTHYQADGLAFQAKYDLILHDHFGLDKPDVDESKKFAYLGGFRAWFILQHFKRFSHKPFMVKITIPKTINGRFFQ